jgi:transposase-like protein
VCAVKCEPDMAATMNKIENGVGGRHFMADVILWAVRWRLQFPISYRDLKRMLADRGWIIRPLSGWTQRSAPEIEKQEWAPSSNNEWLMAGG